MSSESNTSTEYPLLPIKTVDTDMVNRLSALYCVPLEDLISDNEECLQNADDLSGYSADDLKAIADVSRIALNANFMTRRLKANKVL